MFVLRHIAILGFLALITGCAHHPPCGGPGQPTFPKCPTNYLLKVIKIDLATGLVTGKVSDRIPDVKERRERDKDLARRLETAYQFYVRDLNALVAAGRLKEGKEYVFHNGNGSPFLEVFPEGLELPLAHT